MVSHSSLRQKQASLENKMKMPSFRAKLKAEQQAASALAIAAGD
eukprot:gene22694-62302_t